MAIKFVTKGENNRKTLVHFSDFAEEFVFHLEQKQCEKGGKYRNMEAKISTRHNLLPAYVYIFIVNNNSLEA